MVDDLQASYPETTYIAVPKCRDAFDELAANTVLGYPNRYSTTDPREYSDLRQWHGEPVHVLGARQTGNVTQFDDLRSRHCSTIHRSISSASTVTST